MQGKKLYRLYGYLNGMQLLKIDTDELKIIETIDANISMGDMIYFQIIKHENDTDEFYKGIHNFEDYLDYLEDYRERHPEFINQQKQNSPIRKVRKLQK